MTCCVGVAHRGAVWIGGDSAGIHESWKLDVRADRKVFCVGSYAFGFTTSFRHAQTVRYSWSPPKAPEPERTEAFACSELVDSLRRALKRAGALRIEQGVEMGIDCLIGFSGRLFTVHGDWQVSESVRPYAAVGCGAELALGAMAAMWSSRSTRGAESALRRALEISERHCAGVRGPFHVVCAQRGDLREAAADLVV